MVVFDMMSTIQGRPRALRLNQMSMNGSMKMRESAILYLRQKMTDEEGTAFERKALIQGRYRDGESAIK
jgi:hypothetical protein